MSPHRQYFAEMDKQWLSDVITGKENAVKDVNGALASEVISDLFVLGSGALTMSFAIASASLVPLALAPMPLIQLALAYKTIKSLYDQKTKLDNDLHVLQAISHIDEETPENITEMLRDYISIHAEPDQDQSSHRLEVKKLSPDALIVVQKNFRKKKEAKTFKEKAGSASKFLKQEFSNAARMVVKTVANPVSLFRSMHDSSRNVARIYVDWNDVSKNIKADTLRETYKRTLSQAHKDRTYDSIPQKMGGLFENERKNQLYYLHQQQASLRTVSKMRVETLGGFLACSGIVALAVLGALTAQNTLAVAGNVYTAVASLPSLKVLADEMDSLSKTSQKHSPKVNRAAAEFLVGMRSVQAP
ncbi:MAG: hypothetical protein COB76_01615 [Alphaproteobacteria bacterium]|nr:MAG: hypothetical protein COB76_01615 [Alphaproteobacteria bacterium]